MVALDTTQAAIVGRESELSAVREFLGRPDGRRALVVSGEPGIGKTTLWEAGVAAARETGDRVLVARPSEPEFQLGFVALADLFEDVDSADLTGVPRPQLRALDVALLRSEPEDAAPESFAVSAGFTRALRVLGEERPVVVAVDDVPWLDRSSADALSFAARRLSGHPVRFLLARRPGEATGLERAFGPLGLDRIDVGPLSLGATRTLLSARLGLTVPRRVLLRLFETSQGNPLFVLELGRMLVERGTPELGAELPDPDLVDDPFGARVDGLDAPVRRALLALALSGSLGRAQLSALVDPLALEDAVSSGLIVVEGSRARASHPLLASAARRHSTAEERRALHLDLAQAAGDEALRARHLALAATKPDTALAATIAAAAASTIARGAAHDAVEVAEHSVRLTPPDDPEYPERLLELARCLVVAGEIPRARELLDTRIEELPPGRTRARAYLLLSEGADGGEMEAYLDRALAESGDDPAIRATVMATKALLESIGRMHHLDQAEEWAREALEVARSAGPEVERRALHTLAWIYVLRGRPVDELVSRYRSAPQGSSLYESAIERPAGVRLMLRGEVEGAREVFRRLRALAEERGEARSGSVMHVQLCDIELRAGDTEAAARHLDEWDEWSALEDDGGTRLARCRAQLEALQGHPVEAEALARKAISEGERFENVREQLEGMRAAGLAALLAREPARAVEYLGKAWEHTRREGIDDPGAIPVAPDLVEALVELGELNQAAAVTDRLQRLSEEQEHPWGMAGANRCRAAISLGSGEWDEQAAAGLTEAADAYETLGLRFDQARSLLALGRAQRRFRKWAAARSSLEQAAAVFDELGCLGWAEEARVELSRVGGRRRPAGEVLTPAEARVAELAAAGLSNKEIAQTLFVTVHTVEQHLKHVYGKLGIHSRGQLSGRLDPPHRP
jgi:DNA-binding CsgD family transcriptional regulator